MTDATLFPAGLMIVSAITHAGIGVALKSAPDKLIMRALIGATGFAAALIPVFFVPVPAGPAWIFLICGAAVHFIYQMSQIAAFERGDMSLVYPIMRGASPAISAVFAFLILSETLTAIEAVGLGISVAALIGFGWPEKSRPKNATAAIGFALICAVMIALYSVIDAGGMRANREATGRVLSYIVWFFLLDGIGVFCVMLSRRRQTWRADMAAQAKTGIATGLLTLVTFTLALYAFSIAPVAQMSAMRETSVVFGAILAAVLLKEPFGARRIALAFILAAGLILMQVG